MLERIKCELHVLLQQLHEVEAAFLLVVEVEDVEEVEEGEEDETGDFIIIWKQHPCRQYKTTGTEKC